MSEASQLIKALRKLSRREADPGVDKEDFYIVNCYVEGRGDPLRLNPLQLDGYAVLPVEKLLDLLEGRI